MPVKELGNESAVVENHADGERTFMRDLFYAVTTATLMIALLTACQEPQPLSDTESNESFDLPIRKEIVDLGASPYYPDEEDGPATALTCYYFPDFTIKEYDLGGRGAEWLSILLNRDETPECKSSHEPGERMVEYPEWGAYFLGVKGKLAFFDGSDTVNGGLEFAVYDSSNGEKIFEDSAYLERTSSSSYVKVASTSAGYVLKYMRVVVTDCNLNSEGTACWNEIRSKYELSSDDMPQCTGYDHIAELVGTDQVESVIAYPVEVTLSSQPSSQSVAGPVSCWASH